jgi:hypothetical protein
MVIVIYTVLLLACSSILCVFGFFVGRCSRKLPILDDNLPWAIHRGQIPAGECRARQRPNAELPTVTETHYVTRSRWPACFRNLAPATQIGVCRIKTRPTQRHAMVSRHLTSDAKRTSTGRSTEAVFAAGRWNLPEPSRTGFPKRDLSSD